MTKRTWLRSTTLAAVGLGAKAPNADGYTNLGVRSTSLANAIPLSNWHFDRYYANNRYY